jgi:hypothetical protein
LNPPKLKTQVARITEIDELKAEMTVLKAMLKSSIDPNSK